MQYKMKMKHKWKMDVDTQCFKFDYNFFHDIKVTLDLPSSLDVDDHNWTISARSPLKVNVNLSCIIIVCCSDYDQNAFVYRF